MFNRYDFQTAHLLTEILPLLSIESFCLLTSFLGNYFSLDWSSWRILYNIPLLPIHTWSTLLFPPEILYCEWNKSSNLRQLFRMFCRRISFLLLFLKTIVLYFTGDWSETKITFEINIELVLDGSSPKKKSLNIFGIGYIITHIWSLHMHACSTFVHIVNSECCWLFNLQKLCRWLFKLWQRSNKNDPHALDI